jgi:hypothetical protein
VVVPAAGWPSSDRVVQAGGRARVAAAALALLIAVTGVVVVRSARPAEATPAKLQTGSVISTSSQTITLTLPSPSTAGTLLVATFGADGGDRGSTPAGWTKAAVGGDTFVGNQAAVYFYANNPGGISSQAFSFPGSGWMAGQLTEWTGIATASSLDVATPNSTYTSSSASTYPVTAPSATADTDELAVSVWQQTEASASTDSFTPGTGWTNIGSTGSVSKTDHYTADFLTGVNAATTVAETQAASHAGTWEAAIVTFKDACTGGSLAVTPPATLAFGGVTLTGLDQTTTASGAVTASDMRGTGVGWQLDVTSTQFTDGAGHTLPTTAAQATSGGASAATGNCTAATNSVTYPVSVPAGPGPPTAVKIFNSATNAGGGPSTVTIGFSLAVPARAAAVSYSSTWTFTIASGP